MRTALTALLPSLAGLLLLAAPARAQPALADVPELADLGPRWEGAMESFGVPGCAVAVVRDGELLALWSSGQRDPAGQPVGPDTFFYIASITKTYVATAIAALADAGEVDLDAPVRTYLPRFRLADEEAGASITVRELLDHEAGLNCGPIVFLDAYTGQITEDRYYRWLEGVEPLGHIEYTNVHFTLLGRVLESVGGRPWQEHLQVELFDPLSLSRTTAYASRMYGDDDAALPMEGEPGAYRATAVRKTDRVMHAAGGLGTTARDGARWLLAHMPGGTLERQGLLTPETRASMQTLQGAYDEPNGRIRRMEGYGLGWQRGTFRGRPYLVHGGGYVGSAAHMSLLPEEGLGVVVLANSSGGHGLIDILSIDVYDRLLGETGHPDLLPIAVRRLADRREVEPEREPQGTGRLAAGDVSGELDAYVGDFTHADWGTISFREADRGLAARMGDLTLRLTPVRADRFSAVAAGAGTFDGAFLPGEDGRVDTVFLSDDDSIMRFDRE